MKKYISYIATLLCAIAFNISTSSASVTCGNSGSNGHECSCCKNCKSDKCKELCTKYDKLSDDEKKSADGTKVKEECEKLCKTEKCCSSGDKSCDKKAKKGCCSKH